MERRSNTLASFLVWLSIVFGGFLLGIGNAVTGFLGTTDHSQHSTASVLNAERAEAPDGHQHHQQHQQHQQHDEHHGVGSSVAAPAKPAVSAGFMEALPAHCLFCLDGIAPPPISVLAAELLSVTTVANRWLGLAFHSAPLSLRINLFDARAPPLSPEP